MLLAVTAATVFFGWRLLWFLTDDAFIAFRYASCAMDGHGFVWNPPPYLPVEGYTSFLWVVLVTAAWKVTGLAPPETANFMSLLFGYATLFVGYRFVVRLRLSSALERHRFALLCLVMLGTATNRTFLTWLSSGLETSMFNFFLTWWIYEALTPCAARSRSWGYRVSACAALVALTRPDGLLIVLATVALLGADLIQRGAQRERWERVALSALPLLAIPLHVGWRKLTYGEWLPNTYYAKHVTPWPESGIRYAASFLFEYGLWVWLILALFAARVIVGRMLASKLAQWREYVHVAITVGTVSAHVGYYTFFIGGDHFEYRVYSQLILLGFVSTVWMLSALDWRPRVAFPIFIAFILASYPVAWVHWAETQDVTKRGKSYRLIQPIAHNFPPPLRSLVAVWDSWQEWMIERSVGMRHQEHKSFHLHLFKVLPARDEDKGFEPGKRVVIKARSVGVVGWVFPKADILDALGLNDWVIARNPRLRKSFENPEFRQMAHDRKPPPKYVDSFRPIGRQLVSSGIELLPKKQWRPLTEKDIREAEAAGREWIRDRPRRKRERESSSESEERAGPSAGSD